MGINKLQFVDFRHSVVVWQLVVSTERSEVLSAMQLFSSCVLMRWILMNPSSTCWSLIPIQKGLVFKFIIDSRLISGLTQTVCHGTFTGKFVTFLVYFSIFMIFLQLAGWPASLLSFAIRNYWLKCCKELMGGKNSKTAFSDSLQLYANYEKSSLFPGGRSAWNLVGCTGSGDVVLILPA